MHSVRSIQNGPSNQTANVVIRGANVGDYLTGVLVPTERKIRDSFERRFPRTADEIRKEYNSTTIKALTDEELDYPQTESAIARTAEFREGVQHEKHPRLPKKSTLTTGFVTQVTAATIRQIQLLRGDTATFLLKQVQYTSIFDALKTVADFYTLGNKSGSGHRCGISVLQCSLQLGRVVPERRFLIPGPSLQRTTGDERGDGFVQRPACSRKASWFRPVSPSGLLHRTDHMRYSHHGHADHFMVSAGLFYDRSQNGSRRFLYILARQVSRKMQILFHIKLLTLPQLRIRTLYDLSLQSYWCCFRQFRRCFESVRVDGFHPLYIHRVHDSQA